MNFFDTIKAMVPWLTPRQASILLNDFENALFNNNPEYLELPETEQNAIVIREFKKSHHVRRH